MLIIYSALLLVGSFLPIQIKLIILAQNVENYMLVKECKYPPFGYARRHFCSELCLRVQRRHHFCVSECHVFKVRCREPEYPHVSLMNN